MDETILTLQPDGRTGAKLTKRKYDLVKRAILEALSAQPMSYRELSDDVARRLWGKLNASIPWYVKTVKLDLQARKVIEQIPKSPKLRLVKD